MRVLAPPVLETLVTTPPFAPLSTNATDGLLLVHAAEVVTFTEPPRLPQEMSPLAL